MNREFELIYEGKAKKIYEYSKDRVLIHFKDDVTAYNGLKKDSIKRKGVINKKITSFLFAFLGKEGIKTQFIEDYDDSSFIARKLKIVPLEVIVRNYTAGSFVKRYGLENGKKLKHPLIEFSLKDDSLGDPLICENTVLTLEMVKKQDLDYIKQTTLKINELLTEYFNNINLILVDFKLEFGYSGNEIFLADEISPDTCRLWDKDTLKSLDKDVYRKETGDLISTYEALAKRMRLL